MNKAFVSTPTLVLMVLGALVLAGIGYVAINPEALQTLTGGSTHNEQKTSITWRFISEGEAEAVPYTTVEVTVNGTSYTNGPFAGSCSELGATGGVDGKGLLAGELSAAQCWFAGSGAEVGVFAHEDGGYDIMVGELAEGEAGSPMFRGNFYVAQTILP